MYIFVEVNVREAACADNENTVDEENDSTLTATSIAAKYILLFISLCTP